MNRNFLLTVAAASWFCTSLAAQSTVDLPPGASLADGQEAHGYPLGTPGFRTQILIDQNVIAPNGVVLSGLRFRSDRPSLPLSAGSVANVTVTVSQTSVAVGSLGTAFAANVTGPATTVFQGTVNLPAHGPALAGPTPSDLSIAFAAVWVFTTGQGNLLVDIVGNNPGGGSPSYYLDALQAGGSVSPFGVAGNNPSFDHLNLIAATGNSLVPRLLVPGGTVQFISTLSFTRPPGFLLLDLAARAVPLDLGPLGAPTHFVYVDPLLLVPHSWVQTFIGWSSTVSVSVPNNPVFAQALLYAQSSLLDPAANALGVMTSAALETRIGEANTQFPMQQLDANDPAAATGILLDFGFGSPPQYGAVATRLEGTFF